MPRIRALHLITACVALTLGSCAPRGPVLGRSDTSPERTGTISGIVRAAGSNTPLSARRITAVDVTNGTKFETSTASNGGYTIKVPVGRYRLEIELRAGEVVDKGPAELEISRSDVDAARDFFIRVQPR